MMKKILSLLTFVCFVLVINAQTRYFDERYIYTQHFIYPVLVNPGATGIDGSQNLLMNYRNKWATFPGSPKTITLSYDGPVGNRLGFGAQVMNDKNGALNTSKGLVSLSYTIDSEINKVGFGISSEYIQHSVSFVGTDIVDPTDQLLIERLDGKTYFDASFGVFGKYDNKLTYGVSLPSLINSSLEDSTAGVATDSLNRELGYIFNLGYAHYLIGSEVVLEPSVFVKKLPYVPTHIDLNLRIQFLEGRFSGGMSYTLGADKRYGFLLGTKMGSLSFNYNYNISNLQFQDYNNGSHEISIAIDLSRGDDVREIK